MTAPNFFIIGAAKCGTTSLAQYLAQHADVFLPASKEPNYYALTGKELPTAGPASPEVLRGTIYNWSRTERADYDALFAPATDETAIGEASVRYMYVDGTAERIAADVPDARLIAVLRDPTARAYSHYNMNRQILLEPLDFLDAVAAEPARTAKGWGWDWHYTAVGQYGAQLDRFIQVFGRDRLDVVLYDDFAADPGGVYARVCRHLGVDDGFVPDMRKRGMVSSRPRNAWLARQLWWPNRLRTGAVARAPRVATKVIRGLKTLNAAPIPPLPAAERAAVAAHFYDDADRLAEILGRPVPWGRPTT